MEFEIRDLHKFYWIIILLAYSYFLFSIPNTEALKILFIIFYPILICLATISLTRKVIISGRKITTKTILGKKSIVITQNSRIYIKKNVTTINHIIKIHNYEITIINSNQSLKINANVNNHETLYEEISELECSIILPELVNRFSKNNNSLAMDSSLAITPAGVKYKNKLYSYESILKIKLGNGNLSFIKEGKLWETSLFTIPISNIPNLNTFLYLIRIDN